MKLFLWTLLGFIIIWSSATAKTAQLEAEVTKFQCALFADSGFKTWEIIGKTSIFKEQTSELNIKGLYLKIFDGNQNPTLLLTLESPEAIILTQNHKAFGTTYVFISSPHYTALGHGWVFEKMHPDNYKAHFKSDVRVVFKSKKTDPLLSTAPQ